MVAEADHVKGEKGVRLVKRILESTTFVTLPYVVYDTQALTTLHLVNNESKIYDLAGHFVGENVRPLYVEAKNYDTVGHQSAGYKEFLANAYSISLANILRKEDSNAEFMWATWHPFDQGKWPKLTSPKFLRSAVEARVKVDEAFLKGHAVDEDIVRLIADRLWVVPLHRRQDEMLMTREELFSVHAVLERKGMF